MTASQISTRTFLPDLSGSDGDRASTPLLEISNAVVGLYKEAFGRGPTKARTQFAGSDTVVVLLEDAFTPTERTLLALGETGRLRESRLVVQQALEMQVRSVIEHALGRATVAFLTGLDVDHGIALNLCTLEPVSSAGQANGRGSSNNGRDNGQPA